MNQPRKMVVAFGGLLVLSLLVIAAAPELVMEQPHERARREIARINAALEAYRTATGAYPVGNNFVIVRALTGERDGGPAYISLSATQRNERGEMLDPWGTPYEITINPMTGALRIRSAGPDLTFAPPGATIDDDVRGWEPAN